MYPLIYTPLPNSRSLHHTALRYVRSVKLGAYMCRKGLHWVKERLKWAIFRASRTLEGSKKTPIGLKLGPFHLFCIPNGLGLLLEKCVLTHFSPIFGPKRAHFQGTLGFSIGQNTSPRAQNGLKKIVWGSQTVQDHFWKNVFLTHFSPIFGPKRAHFQGTLGFSMGQNASPRAENGLKTLVRASQVV